MLKTILCLASGKKALAGMWIQIMCSSNTGVRKAILGEQHPLRACGHQFCILKIHYGCLQDRTNQDSNTWISRAFSQSVLSLWKSLLALSKQNRKTIFRLYRGGCFATNSFFSSMFDIYKIELIYTLLQGLISSNVFSNVLGYSSMYAVFRHFLTQFWWNVIRILRFQFLLCWVPTFPFSHQYFQTRSSIEIP